MKRPEYQFVVVIALTLPIAWAGCVTTTDAPETSVGDEEQAMAMVEMQPTSGESLPPPGGDLNSESNLGCPPQLIKENLTSNRYNGLACDTLQVVAFYDGASSAHLDIGYQGCGQSGWIAINSIPNFGSKIVTLEYDLNGSTPTGTFKVSGVVANGVIDGLAFGLFWRDTQCNYHTLKSNSNVLLSGASFVGAWPLGMNHSTFGTRTPQLTDGFALETAFATILGAKLLGNGTYSVPVY